MQRGPLAHEPQRARREVTAEHSPIERHRSSVIAVLGVEVRPVVVGLLPIHEDHDPEEGTDSRRDPSVSAHVSAHPAPPRRNPRFEPSSPALSQAAAIDRSLLGRPCGGGSSQERRHARSRPRRTGLIIIPGHPGASAGGLILKLPLCRVGSVSSYLVTAAWAPSGRGASRACERFDSDSDAAIL